MSLFARVRRYLPLLLIAVPFSLLQVPSVQHALFALMALMRSGSVEGMALYAGLYALGGVLALPLALLSAMAGYAYGPVKGVLLAWPSLVLGALVGFASGRLFARSYVRKRMEGNERWSLVEAVLSEDGFKVTLLLRLTPLVPQNFLPYLVASTELKLGEFLLATALGMFPITCLHVYVGSLVQSATQVLEGGTPGPLKVFSLVGGLLLSVLAAVGTARVARRTLERLVAKKAQETAVQRSANEAPS